MDDSKDLQEQLETMLQKCSGPASTKEVESLVFKQVKLF